MNKDISFFLGFFYRFWASLKSKGMKPTFNLLISYFEDLAFDISNRLDTIRQLDLKELNTDSFRSFTYTSIYNGSHVKYVRCLFKTLDLGGDKILVDFGCGKGTVLLIGIEVFLKKVKGIDLSDKVCKIAESNCIKYKRKLKSNTEVEIIKSDVKEYIIKQEDDVFYFFNPFDRCTSEKIYSNILSSITEKRRNVLLIFHAWPPDDELIHKVFTVSDFFKFNFRSINSYIYLII